MGFARRTLFTLSLVVASIVALAAPAAASEVESCFTSSLNAARASAGRAALATRSDLVSIARRHSAQMAASGTIYHNSNLQNEAPSDWVSLGENVGTGATCPDIHQAFMNSAPHRANILDPDYNLVGVGVAIADNGAIYVTEVFEQSSAAAPSGGTSSGSTATAPRKTTSAPRVVSKPKPKPAQAPAAPSPSPSPTPVTEIPERTKAYMGLIEKEDAPPP